MAGEQTSGAQLLIHVGDHYTLRKVGADGLWYREVVSQGSAEMSGRRQGSIALMSVPCRSYVAIRRLAHPMLLRTCETHAEAPLFLRT